MGTIVDGMEYWEASSNQTDEKTEDETSVNAQEEIKFWRDKSRSLELDLRKAEDKNVQLYNEIDFLKNHLENLKGKYDKDDDDLGLEILLREKIFALEDSYAKLRVKYKRNKNEIKELKCQLGDMGYQSFERDSESVSSIFTGDTTEHFVETKKIEELEKQLSLQMMISSQLQEQNDISSEESIKQKELISSLESKNDTLNKEVDTLNIKVTNSLQKIETEKVAHRETKDKSKELHATISNLELKIEEQESKYEHYLNKTNKLLKSITIHMNVLNEELGLKSLNGVNQKMEMEDQLNNLMQSLVSANEKVKELQRGNKSNTLQCHSASATNEVNSDEKVVNYKVTENSNDSSETVSVHANQILLSTIKGKVVPANSLSPNSDEIQTQTHLRKLGVPSFLRSLSQEVEKREQPSTLRNKQISYANTQARDSLTRKSSLLVPESAVRKSSLTIKKDILNVLKNEDSGQFPPFPALLQHIQNKNSEEQRLTETEEDIEKDFALLTMAMKSDRISLLERVGGQRVQRNATEASIEQDIHQMKAYITTINQNCDNSEMRDKILKIEKHLNVLHQSAGRVSAAAESYGAVQVESKVQNAVGLMVKHITNLRVSFAKNKKELTEIKNLLKEYSLMEEEEEFHDLTKKRNFSTSIINESLAEAEFSTINVNSTQDHDDELQNRKEFEQTELESTFLEENSSMVLNSSPPSRRESQNSTPELLHVNSMELSQTARRLTVGWLTEIEIPTWLDLDKLPDMENIFWFSRFFLAMTLVVSAVGVLWSTFST